MCGSLLFWLSNLPLPQNEIINFMSCICVDNIGLILVILDLVGLLLPVIIDSIGLYNIGIIHVIRFIALFKSIRVLRVLRAIRLV